MRLEEALHIGASVVTISLAFTIVWAQSLAVAAETFLVVLFTVGIGFILHELAHKYVAQHYRAWAEYRAWTLGLALAVGLAVTIGVVFAAPGAVFIYGPHLSRRQNGHIAIAGAGMNLALALAFVVLGLAVPELREFARLGASVNVFLGWFNTLPFFPLDGQKVWAWNKGVWALAMVVLSGLMLFLPLR
jgi:Zn-dependent protease